MYGAKKRLTEYEAIVGFFDEDDEIGRKYRKKESERLAKVSDSLEKAGKVNESVHYSALSTRVFNAERNVSVKISEIYDYLNEKFPFALQEKWDNSGLLVNHNSEYCSKLLLTLDITNSVISEAYEKKANLIISHHPVIFDPLKKIDSYNPVYNLVNRGINAICMHTNLDIAEGGTNTVIVKKLSEKLEISENIQPFEEIGNGVGLGYIVELNETIDSSQFALILKEIFGCKCLKMNDNGKKYISKIAVCSGSGGSLLGLAMVKDCDAMITGDVKHDVWIDANNHCFTLFDCGHFHTENHVLWELRRVLEEKFPLLDVEIAESSVDPCVYF